MRRYLFLLIALLVVFFVLPRMRHNRKQFDFVLNVLTFALLAYIAWNIYYVFSRY